MGISKEQVETAVRGLLSQDKYKPLSPHIGGWFWASKAIWGIIGSFQSLGIASLEAMTLTALTVPSQISDLLNEFVNELFEIFSIIADEASDIPDDADEFSQSPTGRAVLGMISPEQQLMGRAGTDDRTLQAIAGVLNPMPGAVKFGASAAKNAVDAGKRIVGTKGR